MRVPTLRRLVAASLAIAAVAAALPAAALADDDDDDPPVLAVPTECPTQVAKQIFLPIFDENWYFLAPGGDFEGEPGWTLDPTASIVQRPDYTEYFGHRTLRLPAGGSAASPGFCVDASLPHLRMGLRASSLDASLLVEAVVDGQPVRLATLSGSRYVIPWVSPFIPLAAPLGLAPEEHLETALRLTAVSGTWEVDGVSIDPKSTR